ncbi:MAG: hypothetical protein C0596_00425 [Marinilabiliales bacterium]|nr:MAG: hypothetical protein C0596_00425 [Marinilabiliales bacterium]
MIGDSLLISYSYNNIGSTLLEKKEFQEALEYFEISLDIKLRNSFTGVAATYNNMGLSYQEMDDYPKSRDFYKASYDYCHQNKDDYGIVTSAINLGVINHLMNNSAKAEKYFLEAYNIAFKNGYKKLIVEATEFAHDFFYDMGRYEQAYDMLKQYVIYSDSIQNDDVIKEIARLEAEFEYNQKQISDSIMYHQQKIHDEALHEEELKRKEQLIWILAVTFAFIVFIAFALFKAYQLRRKNRENQLKQQALEIEKNLLRSQMNPHFIFNAMNSIQSFIAENDSYSALRYLSKFAKLIRLILENSMHQNIQLQDELQSLELYMELEKVRFNNKFDFKINIDDKIESDIIEVPPMLIQPFVENAIIHGVMPLEKEGLIEINMRKIDGENLILCEVTDNGIGREASAALKKSHGKKHKSVGMQVSRQRLESLNKQTQKEMSYQVEDIVCDGKVCGTKVSIIIPFISEF